MPPRRSDARAVALSLLQLVLDRRQSLDEAIERHDGLAALEPRDRAFARLLAATTLRRPRCWIAGRRWDVTSAREGVEWPGGGEADTTRED